MKETTDSFGRAMLDWVKGGATPEIIERNDGIIEIGAGPDGYLSQFRDWPVTERRALKYVRGRVADVGCGGGRVSLHFQKQGFDVVGIDVSPNAIRAALHYGVWATWCVSVDQVHERIAEFDTIILFGNNLGVFGTPAHAKKVLTKWATRVTPGTRIFIESTNPYSGGAPIIDRAYCRNNRENGVAIGQCRLRVWYDRSPSKWFSWFFASQTDLKVLMRGTGWRLVRVESSANDEPYVAIFESS